MGYHRLPWVTVRLPQMVGGLPQTVVRWSLTGRTVTNGFEFFQERDRTGVRKVLRKSLIIKGPFWTPPRVFRPDLSGLGLSQFGTRNGEYALVFTFFWSECVGLYPPTGCLGAVGRTDSNWLTRIIPEVNIAFIITASREMEERWETQPSNSEHPGRTTTISRLLCRR